MTTEDPRSLGPMTVPLRFLGEDCNLDARVEVAFREGGMTLDVVDEEGNAYVVPGNLVPGQAFLAGEEMSPPVGKQPVVARWALLGDRFVGYWLEPGAGEWLFWFPDPRRAGVSRD